MRIIILYVNTLPKYTLSENFDDMYPILIHYRTTSYLNTWLNYTLSQYLAIGCRKKLLPAIRIEYYVTRVGSQSELSTINLSTSSANQNRVGSQSESSITSPESSCLGWRSFLGSRLHSARYSPSQYIGTSNPRLICSLSYY